MIKHLVGFAPSTCDYVSHQPFVYRFCPPPPAAILGVLDKVYNHLVAQQMGDDPYPQKRYPSVHLAFSNHSERTSRVRRNRELLKVKPLDLTPTTAYIYTM